MALNNSLEWRRSKVLELASQGYNQSDISRILQISQPTISRDLHYLEEQARNNIRNHIDKKLPFEYDKCMVALNSLQRRAWEISERSEEERTQVQALSLAKDCVINKLELLTNATVVNDAMRFAHNSKDKLKGTKEQDSQNSKEPDYHDKGSSDKQAEEKQEEEIGEISTETINHVF